MICICSQQSHPDDPISTSAHKSPPLTSFENTNKQSKIETIYINVDDGQVGPGLLPSGWRVQALDWNAEHSRFSFAFPVGWFPILPVSTPPSPSHQRKEASFKWGLVLGCVGLMVKRGALTRLFSFSGTDQALAPERWYASFLHVAILVL